MFSRLLLASISLLLSSAAFTQEQQVAPLPSSSFELATNGVQTADTPEKRAAALNLLERARQNTDLHGQSSAPYILKVSFDSTGAVQHTGSGKLEEIWLSGRTYRWTASMGDYWQVRLSYQGRIYDQRRGDLIPLRVRMLRTVVFWPIHNPAIRASLRTVNATWKGAAVTCVLVAGPGLAPAPGRRWEETEYCIDQKTGLLQIYSEAPGIYTIYDYAGGTQFHGHVLPSQITIFEGSNPVLTAHIEAMADGSKTDPDFLKPTEQMQAAGPEPVLTSPMRFPQIVKSAAAGSGAIVQPVIIHAIIGEDGKVLDAEILPGGNPALEQSALEIVKNTAYSPVRAEHAQREAFINVKFMPEGSTQARANTNK
ncbi:MAG: hypothetical protein DMG65_02780 [Candidatus Angelobacter sp. Gp1-AA117]|nr:MAG: hypothetical protein DMG65_02780 [Candidatus Angelobacter sp. Gp1-AA117]